MSHIFRFVDRDDLFTRRRLETEGLALHLCALCDAFEGLKQRRNAGRSRLRRMRKLVGRGKNLAPKK